MIALVKMTLSIATLRMTALTIMSLSIITLCILKDSITAHSIKPVSIIANFINSAMEASLKDQAQYSRPPCTNQFSSAALYIEKLLLNFFLQQATMIRR